MLLRRSLVLVLALAALAFPAGPARALDDQHWVVADQAINKGIAYLRSTQGEDGSWTPKSGPAVTAIAVRAMLGRRDISADDPAIQKAVAFILKHVQPDGSIHPGFLETYNTALSVSALSMIKGDPKVAEAVKNAVAWLKKTQWQGGMTDPQGKPVTEDHPFYGGFGYGGKHGRPDFSNSQLALDALRDAGVASDDPAFQRAVIFATRLQGVPENKMFGDRIEPGGGAIYATSVNKEQVGVPQTFTKREVTSSDGKTLLATYGSMTYAVFKAYVLADIDRKDPRVRAAYRWIQNHYTTEHNPGMAEDEKLHGHFYYLMTMSKTLDAWGATTIATAEGKNRDWANDMVDQLVQSQRPDGSWTNPADRWMEGDPNLVTGYALHALLAAVN